MAHSVGCGSYLKPERRSLPPTAFQQAAQTLRCTAEVSCLLNSSEVEKHLWAFLSPQKRTRLRKYSSEGPWSTDLFLTPFLVVFDHIHKHSCPSSLINLKILSPLSVMLFRTSALQQSLPIPRKSQQESEELFHCPCQYFT